MFQGLVGHSPPKAKQPVRPVTWQKLVRAPAEQQTQTLTKEKTLNMIWTLSQVQTRPRQLRVRYDISCNHVLFCHSCILGVKQVLSVTCHVCMLFLFFFFRHWMGSRLWRSEFKGSCSRSGLLSLGHSSVSASCNRGWGEGMGQVHGLSAFLLVSLGALYLRRVHCLKSI